MDKTKVDHAIDQAAANMSFEGMNLTSDERKQIKRDLEEKRSLLLSFLDLYKKRQRNKHDKGGKDTCKKK